MKLYIGATLPAAVAERFPPDPSGRRGDPHITLLYTDEATDDGPVREVVERVLGGRVVDVALAGPVEYFAGAGEGDAAAVLPLARDLWLHLLHAELRAELRVAGVETPQRFDAYQPHATLLYAPKGATYDGPLPDGPVRLDAWVMRIDDGELVRIGRATERFADPAALEAAVRDHRKVRIAYTSADGRQTTRVVHPYEVKAEAEGAVLGAHCELRSAYRTFRVKRIGAIEVLDETFDPANPSARPTVKPDEPRDERLSACFRELRLGADLEQEAARRLAGVQVPEGFEVGKAFRCAADGEVFCRWSGKKRGASITRADLEDSVAIWETGEEIGIDKDHDVERPDGVVLAMWVVNDGDRYSLAVLPAYGPRLAAYVRASSGALWSSPELVWGDVYDPRTGARVGGMRVHSLAICASPAQAHRVLDRVRLSDSRGHGTRPLAEGVPPDAPAPTEENTVDEETKALLATIVARLDKIEGAKGKDEGKEEASAEMGDAARAALSARGGADEVTAKVAALEAEKDRLTRELAIRETLSDGRMTPAERQVADEVWAKGGEPLFRTVFGSRPKNSAVPTVKGHGKPVDEATGDIDQQRDKQVQARMAASKVGYHTAVRELLNERHPLFVDA